MLDSDRESHAEAAAEAELTPIQHTKCQMSVREKEKAMGIYIVLAFVDGTMLISWKPRGISKAPSCLNGNRPRLLSKRQYEHKPEAGRSACRTRSAYASCLRQLNASISSSAKWR